MCFRPRSISIITTSSTHQGNPAHSFPCKPLNSPRYDIEPQQPIQRIRGDVMPVIVSPGYRAPGRIVEIVKFDADRLNLRVGTGADFKNSSISTSDGFAAAPPVTLLQR
jgi:hypothetical protein